MGDKGSCLLVKQNDKHFAIGSKCSHYGASLANGALGDGVVTCPWHGACFNLENGDIEDFPGLDSLPKYDVQVENGEVKVSLKDIDTQKGGQRLLVCNGSRYLTRRLTVTDTVSGRNEPLVKVCFNDDKQVESVAG